MVCTMPNKAAELLNVFVRSAANRAFGKGATPWFFQAYAKGQIVLVVDARSAKETANARDVIRAPVGDVKDGAVMSAA